MTNKYYGIGAIIGDVVGSRFEFSNINSTEFNLFDRGCCFTDDTVLTVAVMDYLMSRKTKYPEECAEYLLKWAKKYPQAGYGSRFYKWVFGKDHHPYGSYGNGSAMRISPVGFVFDGFDDVTNESNLITGITHNHPEGMKGASVIASIVSMAFNGKTKDEIAKYARKYYKISENIEELRTTSHGEESCQVTVPAAISVFMLTNSFEECLRVAVSLGGDTDTLADIACAMAEAYYQDISEDIVDKVLTYLPNDMLDVIEDFSSLIRAKLAMRNDTTKAYIEPEINDLKMKEYKVVLSERDLPMLRSVLEDFESPQEYVNYLVTVDTELFGTNDECYELIPFIEYKKYMVMRDKEHLEVEFDKTLELITEYIRDIYRVKYPSSTLEEYLNASIITVPTNDKFDLMVYEIMKVVELRKLMKGK